MSCHDCAVCANMMHYSSLEDKDIRSSHTVSKIFPNSDSSSRLSISTANLTRQPTIRTLKPPKMGPSHDDDGPPPQSTPAISTLTLALEITILILATTTLGLSSAYAKQLLSAPQIAGSLGAVITAIGTAAHTPRAAGLEMSPSHHPRAVTDPSNTRVVLSSGAMPLLSVIFAALGIALCVRRRRHGVYTLLVAALMLAGWCVSVTWWAACEGGVRTDGFVGPRSESISVP